nr:NADH dehydrogenase subunit 4 [Stenochironomus sp. 1CZ]
MLKFIFFLNFLIFLFFLKNKKYFYLNLQNFFFFFFFSFFFLNINNMMFSVNFGFGLDFMSFVFILLSIWICCLMILSSFMIFKFNLYSNYFLFLVLFLLIFLLLTFSSLNLFMFYFWFEATLIPVIFMIFGWGLQPERIQASLYLLFYTLFASLPLLFCLFYVYKKEFYSLDLLFLNNEIKMMNFYVFFFFIFAFLVKLPMFMVHVWLPKAHVEAPVAGSMILAGLLLKLGGYGMMRILFLILDYVLKYNFFFVIFSLMGGSLISLMCLRQVDLKSLVAYSSVAHMSLVIGGLMIFYIMGWGFSFCLMIAHGLCSSALFFLVNISYERLNSRSLLINKGLMVFFPNLTFWWFLFCAGNMAAPPSLNLLGEIGLLSSILGWSKFIIIFLMILSFFSAAYSLYLFSFSQHGKFNFSNFGCFFSNVREYLILFLHGVPMNFLILKSDLMIFF